MVFYENSISIDEGISIDRGGGIIQGDVGCGCNLDSILPRETSDGSIDFGFDELSGGDLVRIGSCWCSWCGWSTGEYWRSEVRLIC